MMRERAQMTDARLISLEESIAEISARLQIVCESQARLEATVERQLELIEHLATTQSRLLSLLENPSVTMPTMPTLAVSEHRPRSGSQADADSRDTITDNGNEYARDTHPALFRVIDLLQENEHMRGLSVRQLARETGVSKSWCAVAKRYVSGGKSVH